MFGGHRASALIWLKTLPGQELLWYNPAPWRIEIGGVAQWQSRGLISPFSTARAMEKVRA